MYRYRLKKRLFHRMFIHRTPGTKWWDTQWQHRLDFLDRIGVKDRSDGFRILHALGNRFICFESPKPVDKVPVYGFLIPVEVFEEMRV